MQVQSLEILLTWILSELEQRQSIFGIPQSLFYNPTEDRALADPDFLGQCLATPIGPAAGPHTQLAQNIVSAWLCGGRFIELKTVQIRDDLEIPRPCIDMEDEGYNVEWSQELKLDQSADEYLKAWFLIHILHRLLGFEGRAPLGTIFNMSIGYDLEGIRSAPMSRFLARMNDATEEIAGFRAWLKAKFPRFADLEIPPRLASSVTLSTLHGCPPDEIKQMARFLLEEKGLHTIIKLNPTLLGRERVLGILHQDLGFREIQVPDAVFEHDLQYPRAVALIESLGSVATGCNLTLGIKLTNTLPTCNHKGILPGSATYMSGRALYPLAMSLFHTLSEEFHGSLNVSYSGGADAINLSTILACGARPVTVATDLLKPGGYGRLVQYLANLKREMSDRGASSLNELAQDKRLNLRRAAADALTDPRYRKRHPSADLPKVDSGLTLFDCIAAPCVERCAVHQDVPEYAWLISQGEYDRALAVVLARNPLPGVTGFVCTHLCEARCTRSASNYEEPVAIRALKRFVAERGRNVVPVRDKTGFRVAIIGSGPSGLAAAYFLAWNGMSVTIFESRDVAGGMMRLAPAFRLPASVIDEDVERIVRMGVDIRLSHPVTGPPEDLLKCGFDAVYLATGFQRDATLPMEGSDAQGVLHALEFLRRTRAGDPVKVGPRVLVIGGGDTALDAARVAKRLATHSVTVVYRRTRGEMPATQEDQEGAFEEGILLEELSSPVRVIVEEGRVAALECIRNQPGNSEADGRRRPVPVAGSEIQIPADTIIVGVGQKPGSFIPERKLRSSAA